MNFDDSGVNILLRVRLHMAGDDVAPGIAELLRIPLRAVDHQVDIQRQRRHRADGLHHRDADGDIGDEQAVHHIHMDIVGGVDALNVAAEVGKVGRQNGRGYTDHESTSGTRSANRRMAGGIK